VLQCNICHKVNLHCIGHSQYLDGWPSFERVNHFKGCLARLFADRQRCCIITWGQDPGHALPALPSYQTVWLVTSNLGFLYHFMGMADQSTVKWCHLQGHRASIGGRNEDCFVRRNCVITIVPFNSQQSVQHFEHKSWRASTKSVFSPQKSGNVKPEFDKWFKSRGDDVCRRRAYLIRRPRLQLCGTWAKKKFL
jgi:hypothetical protein